MGYLTGARFFRSSNRFKITKNVAPWAAVCDGWLNSITTARIRALGAADYLQIEANAKRKSPLESHPRRGIAFSYETSPFAPAGAAVLSYGSTMKRYHDIVGDGVEGLRTNNPDELASAAKRAVDRRRSLVIGVPVSDADYHRVF